MAAKASYLRIMKTSCVSFIHGLYGHTRILYFFAMVHVSTLALYVIPGRSFILHTDTCTHDNTKSSVILKEPYNLSNLEKTHG